MGEKCTGAAVWALTWTEAHRMGRDACQLPRLLPEEIIGHCGGLPFTPAWVSPQILRIGLYSKLLGQPSLSPQCEHS